MGASWRSLAIGGAVTLLIWGALETHAPGPEGQLPVVRRPSIDGGGGWAPFRPGDLLPTIRRPSVGSGSAAFKLCGGKRRDNCVVDGDTIRYHNDVVRLQDIDAPEIASPRCAAEAALGRRATLRLLELMNDGVFQIVVDGRRDRYGRRLGTIERNGRSLGDVLVSEGLARPWSGARRSWCS